MTTATTSEGTSSGASAADMTTAGDAAEAEAAAAAAAATHLSAVRLPPIGPAEIRDSYRREGGPAEDGEDASPGSSAAMTTGAAADMDAETGSRRHADATTSRPTKE